MPRKGGVKQNLKPFKKGDDSRRNMEGRPKKLPDLDMLLGNVFGSDEMERVLKSVYAKALKGDTRAAEIILERGYGKVRQSIDSTVVGEQTIKVVYDGAVNNLISPASPKPNQDLPE